MIKVKHHNLISVGSPKSATKLKENTNKVGANLTDQINHTNDPVANGLLNEDADYEFNKLPEHSFESYYPLIYNRIIKNDK